MFSEVKPCCDFSSDVRQTDNLRPNPTKRRKSPNPTKRRKSPTRRKSPQQRGGRVQRNNVLFSFTENLKISVEKTSYNKSAVDFLQDLFLVERHGFSFPLLYPLLLQLLAGVHLPCGSYLTRTHLGVMGNGMIHVNKMNLDSVYIYDIIS